MQQDAEETVDAEFSKASSYPPVEIIWMIADCWKREKDLQKTLSKARRLNKHWYEILTPRLYQAPQFSKSSNLKKFVKILTTLPTFPHEFDQFQIAKLDFVIKAEQQFSKVSRPMLSLIQSDRLDWEHVDTLHVPNLGQSPAPIRMLEKCPRLQNVAFGLGTNPLLVALANRLTDEDPIVLKSIYIEGCRGGRALVRVLNALVQQDELEKFVIHAPDIENDVISLIIPLMHRLKVFRFTQNRQITTSTLVNMVSQGPLMIQHLDLGGCLGIFNDAFMEALVSCPGVVENLKRLTLGYNNRGYPNFTSIENRSVAYYKHLSKLINLTTLRVGKHFGCNGFTDLDSFEWMIRGDNYVGMPAFDPTKPITGLTRLKGLDIHGNHVEPNHLTLLVEMVPDLEYLDIDDCCGLRFNDVFPLHALQNLKSLDARCVNVHDRSRLEAFEHVAIQSWGNEDLSKELLWDETNGSLQESRD